MKKTILVKNKTSATNFINKLLKPNVVWSDKTVPFKGKVLKYKCRKMINTDIDNRMNNDLNTLNNILDKSSLFLA